MARQRKNTTQQNTPQQKTSQQKTTIEKQPGEKQTLTKDQINNMSVIQIRMFVQEQHDPDLDCLMDIFRRDLLREKLIEKLGL
ncbi:MAG: hypothetical protein WC401_02205 [Bacteroidales bacterium]